MPIKKNELITFETNFYKYKVRLNVKNMPKINVTK
jgi:hypothetical protein